MAWSAESGVSDRASTVVAIDLSAHDGTANVAKVEAHFDMA